MRKLFLALCLCLPLELRAAVPAVDNFITNNFDWQQAQKTMALQSQQALGFLTLSNGFIVTVPNGTQPYVFMSQAEVGGYWVDIRNYGATTGSADNTAAMQAAINTGHNVWVPEGVWTNTGQIKLTNQFQRIMGRSPLLSKIVFNPAASNTCILVGGLSDKLFQTGVSDLGLICASNAVDKTALDITDVSLSEFSNLQINPWFSNAGSTNTVGILTRGRDTTRMKKLSVFATVPVLIARNPNTYIDQDHWHWEDCEFVGTGGKACILVDEGVYISETSFEGYQTWSQGENGFFWYSTNALHSSHGLHFTSVRREQQQSTNGYSIYIDHSNGTNTAGTSLYNLTIAKSYIDYSQNGVFLRGVHDATFTALSFPQTGENVMLNIASDLVGTNTIGQVQQLFLQNCFVQQNTNYGTTVLDGMTNVFKFPNQLSAPLPETGLFLSGTQPPPTSMGDAEIKGFLRLGKNSDTVFDEQGFAITPLGVETGDFTNSVQGSRFQMNLTTSLGNAVARLDAYINGANGNGNIAMNSGGSDIGAGSVGIGTTNVLERLTVNNGKIMLKNPDYDIGVTGSASTLSLDAGTNNANLKLDSFINGGNGKGTISLNTDFVIDSIGRASFQGQTNLIGDNGSALTFNGVPIGGGGTFNPTANRLPIFNGTGWSDSLVEQAAITSTNLLMLDPTTSFPTLTVYNPENHSITIDQTGGTTTIQSANDSIFFGSGGAVSLTSYSDVGAVASGKRLELHNSTSASADTQRNSQSLAWIGQGWATNSATSMNVQFSAYVFPHSGGDDPYGEWNLQANVDVLADNTVFSVSSQGPIILKGITKAQKTAIINPQDGMLVYQTDNTPGLRAYIGGSWVILNTSADP